MTVSYQDIVLAFDMSRVESVSGTRYLWDYSKNGLHFQFAGGGTDPTPQLDGSLYFAAQYLALPAAQQARYYAAMPTGEHTWLFAYEQYGAALPCFSTMGVGGGFNYGQNLYVFDAGSANGARVYNYTGTALGPYVQMAVVTPRTGIYAVTVEATPRSLVNQRSVTTTWPVGAYGPTVYDAATTPRIGGSPLFGYCTGKWRYLALVRGAVSSPDLSLLSRLVVEGSTKPFCVRQ